MQVRPRPGDLEVADALSRVAAANRFVPPEPPADVTTDRFTSYFLGAFVDAEDHGPGQPVWFGGFARDDVAAVDIGEFNRGWPWRPSARYRSTEQALTAELRHRFGVGVRVVTKPKQRVEPRPRATR